MKRFMAIALVTIVTSLVTSESADACRRCCQPRRCQPARTVCCTPCCYSHSQNAVSAAVVESQPMNGCGCGNGQMTEMGTVVESQPSGDVIMEQPVTAPPAQPAVPAEAPEVPEAPSEG